MDVQEEFRPISLKFDGSRVGRIVFAVRRLTDLWLRKLRKYLNRTSSPMQGRVLGASYGESPLANLMAAAGTYVALDIAERHMTTVGLMPPSRRLVAPVRSAIPTSRGVQRTKQFA